MWFPGWETGPWSLAGHAIPPSAGIRSYGELDEEEERTKDQLDRLTESDDDEELEGETPSSE